MLKNNKFLIFASILFLVLLVFAVIFAFQTVKPLDADYEPKENQFAVLSTTDMHGKVWDEDLLTNVHEPNNYLSVATVIGDIYSHFERRYYLVDNGDAYQGSDIATYPLKESVYSKYHYLSPVAIAMQFIRYNCLVLGNHEFNYSWEIMKNTYDYLHHAGIDCVCANIYDSNTGQRIFKPYDLDKISIEGRDFTIANIGLENTDIPRWDDPENYPNFIFHSPENPNADLAYEVNKVKKEMKDNNVHYDFLIVSAHTGFVPEGAKYDANKDYMAEFEKQSNEPLEYLKNTENQAYRIVKNTEGVDMLVCGHDHVDYFSNTKMKNANGDEVLVVNGGGKSITESVFSANFDDKANKFNVNLDWSKNLDLSDYPSDNSIKGVLDTYSQDSIKYMDRHVATLGGNFDEDKDLTMDDYILHQTDAEDLIGRGTISQASKYLKQQFGNMDKFNESITSQNKPAITDTNDVKADFSMINPGTISRNPKDGEFKIKDLYMLYRFPNRIEAIPLTGKEIKDILEFNASERLTIDGYTGDKYSYTLFYGLNFVYDMNKPAGSRVEIQGTNNGRDFDLSKTYIVVTNNYLVGNSFSPQLGKIKDSNDLFKNLPGDGLLVDYLKDYLMELDDNYGVVYNTANCEKNGEKPCHWEIRK